MEEENFEEGEFINPGDPGYDDEPQDEFINPGDPGYDDNSGVPGSVRPMPAVQLGPQIINFDVDNPKHTAAQRARERFAYNEALGIKGASLTDESLTRAAGITQQMRDPNLSSRNLMQLHQELQGLDVGYSPQQIQRIQGLNQQKSVLDEQLAVGQIGEDQHLAGSSMLGNMIAAIKPQRMPQKKSPWPQGQGVGDQWTSNTGDLVTRDDKGAVKVLTKYPMTPKGLEEKYFFDSYNAALKITVENADSVKRHLTADEAAVYATKSLETWKKIQQQRRDMQEPTPESAPEQTQPSSRAGALTQGPPDEAKQLREQLTKSMAGRKINDIKNPVERQRLASMYQKLKQLETKR